MALDVDIVEELVEVVAFFDVADFEVDVAEVWLELFEEDEGEGGFLGVFELREVHRLAREVRFPAYSRSMSR